MSTRSRAILLDRSCELPAARGLPLSRLSTADVAAEVRRSGLVATISDATVWRWPLPES